MASSTLECPPNTTLDRRKLTAFVTAQANIAEAALRDAYTILANNEVDDLSSAGLSAKLPAIRNESCDITALVETDLQAAHKVPEDATLNFTDVEMNVLWRAFTAAMGAEMDVTKELFEYCVYCWKPNKLKRRAQLHLRANRRQHVERECSDAKALLKQVESRRYWRASADVLRLRGLVVGERARQLDTRRREVAQQAGQEPQQMTKLADVLGEQDKRRLYAAYREETGAMEPEKEGFERCCKVVMALIGYRWRR